tara:strand:- start:50 stop:631 length:582 start_codon:yes stop_codon:yes gene_type:complete
MNTYYLFPHKILSTKITDKNINSINILSELNDNKKKYTFTHYINNRWENIYISPQYIPSILPFISFVTSLSIKYYNNLLMPHQTLIIPHELLGYQKNEFWFNISKHGDSTRLHNHNQKALLSGVFYLDVPKDSGNIIFKNSKKKELEIKAEAGKIIFFPPELDHYVTINNSKNKRISISFNCYKFPMLSRKNK